MKVCENLLKTNLFKIYNSLKNIEYSLYGFSTTEIFIEILNRPIRDEGGKIQISKLVQLWTKVLRNWDQILE